MEDARRAQVLPHSSPEHPFISSSEFPCTSSPANLLQSERESVRALILASQTNSLQTELASLSALETKSEEEHKKKKEKLLAQFADVTPQ